MPHTPADLLARLDALGIAHQTITHAPVFTVEESNALLGHLPGGHCKSLFLKDKAGQLWLLVCLDHRRIDMNRLAKVLGCPRLSFGKAALLEAVLGVTPGSVTPFALINDEQRQVRPLLDAKMLAHAQLNYHPLINTRTTTIAAADLPRFVAALGYEVRLLDLDAEGIDRNAEAAA
jgi:Ala-tRNA(Pro) deacylase